MEIGNFVAKNGEVTTKNTHHLVVFDVERKLAISCTYIDKQSHIIYARKAAELAGGRLPDAYDIEALCKNASLLRSKTKFLGEGADYDTFIWTNHSVGEDGLLFECGGTHRYSGDDGYMLYSSLGKRTGYVFVVHELEKLPQNTKEKPPLANTPEGGIKFGQYLNVGRIDRWLSNECSDTSVAMVYDVDKRLAVSLDVLPKTSFEMAGKYAISIGARVPDVYEVCEILEKKKELASAGFTFKKGWTANAMGIGAFMYVADGDADYEGLIFDRPAEESSIPYHVIYDF